MTRANPRANPDRTWSESITDWQLATFGEATPERAFDRFLEEFDEMAGASAVDTSNEKLAEEAADVVITLAAWVKARTGLDLAIAVEQKMLVNRERKWDVRGDGTGYHVREDRTGASEESK